MSLLSSRRQADLSRLEGQIDLWSEKALISHYLKNSMLIKMLGFLGLL